VSNKVIIVAAGRGRRLGPETAGIPKCMVRVAGQPILHWQLRAFAAAGISEVVVVRGYLGDRIASNGTALCFVDNPEWSTNNILASLLCAADQWPGGFFFSYCDIVYTPDVVARLAASARAANPRPVSLIIDRRWADAYQGRTLHPVSEAELALVQGQGDEARVFPPKPPSLCARFGTRRLQAAAWRPHLAAPRPCARPTLPMRSTRWPTRACSWHRFSSTGNGARSTRPRIWPPQKQPSRTGKPRLCCAFPVESG
jgi:CTP:molybdopterin cytidylyltransferase MocA